MGNLPDCFYEYRFNREEPRAVETCTECGYSIYVGESYYPIGDKIICCECIEDFKEEAKDTEF